MKRQCGFSNSTQAGNGLLRSLSDYLAFALIQLFGNLF